jgi:hypothetical protein
LIEPKDVVLAILGSAAGLAGFVLVFLGIIIASYQSYPGEVPVAVVRPYRIAGTALLAAFGLGLVTVAVTSRVVERRSDDLYAYDRALRPPVVASFGVSRSATRAWCSGGSDGAQPEKAV